MNIINKKIASVLILIAFVISGTLATPATTYALGAVPVDTTFNFHSIQQQTKDFVLNSLAWNVAKMTLQQLTTSIVNWINTGFEGSPAFIDNPEAFFLDLGDQVTGNFIANVGPLQSLCSPWNIDLRLSLALGQTRSMSERYRCTLSTLIGNAQNATINGYSIEGFTSGDFAQGGWPAFMIMTSEPRNNPYGSYLQAKSDLDQQIAAKQNSVNSDLDRGQGFLSWQKCVPTNVNSNTGNASSLGLNQNDLAQLNANGSVNANGTSYKTSTDPETGYTVYETCSVQTPGSVISAGLNKSLGSSVDQLNLADSINEITSALFAQLISQVFTKGLGGSSQRSGGQTQSYIEQLNAQSRGAGAYSNSTQNIQASYAIYLTDAQSIVSTYQQAVGAFDTTRSSFSIAQGCFQDIALVATKQTIKNEAQRNADAIQSLLINQFGPAALIYSDKLSTANRIVSTINSRVNSAQNITDAQSAQTASNQLQEFIATQVPAIQQGKDLGAADLTAARAQAAQFKTNADQYMNMCTSLKSQSGSSR
ncbi:MAG: hypothetical protein RLY66_64 [Candidatus Parcubacteria bacterium]|jgi:hypothetical protein